MATSWRDSAAPSSRCGAVDRLRGVREAGLDAAAAAPVVLAATDPANPYGAALAWPSPSGDSGHGPRRGAGALVVLADGALALYVERGGRSLLSFGVPDEALAAAVAVLADSVRGGRVGRLLVGRIDRGEPADPPLVAHLRAAGFADHPRGLVLRP